MFQLYVVFGFAERLTNCITFLSEAVDETFQEVEACLIKNVICRANYMSELCLKKSGDFIRFAR